MHSLSMAESILQAALEEAENYKGKRNKAISAKIGGWGYRGDAFISGDSRGKQLKRGKPCVLQFPLKSRK